MISTSVTGNGKGSAENQLNVKYNTKIGFEVNKLRNAEGTPAFLPSDNFSSEYLQGEGSNQSVYNAADLTDLGTLNPSSGEVVVVADYDGFGNPNTYIWNGTSWQAIEVPASVIASGVNYDNSLSGLTSLNLQDASDEIKSYLDNIALLNGIALNASNLGSFSGNIISDNIDIKTALQELETFVSPSYSAEQNSNFTAVSGNVYLTNTTGGSVSIFSPVAPNVGDKFSVIDSRANSQINNINVDFTATLFYGSAGLDVINENGSYITYEYTGPVIG